jgi:hypothetical protein
LSKRMLALSGGGGVSRGSLGCRETSEAVALIN